MPYDHYTLLRTDLKDIFAALEQAYQAIETGKQDKDKNARKQAEEQLRNAAYRAAAIEPHMAYLWFWAKREEADRAKNDNTKKKFSEIANAIRDAWQRTLKVKTIPKEFHSIPDTTIISRMPSLSFVLHIPFRLEKPYLSKDERDFYLLDNPLRREKVFQVPMVAATSWKGALRAALWQLGYREDHEVTIRLFGNPRGHDEHQAGRLYFFPTFFDQIGLEVINPHNRQTGVGERGPILMECVPTGTKGDLTLLYVPFGPMGQSEEGRRREVAEDLMVLAEGVRAMLLTYGFGAKTSSGYGVAEEKLAGEGKLVIRAKLTNESAVDSEPSKPQTSSLPRYLETPTRLIPELRRDDGSLKSEEEYRLWVESQGRKYKKKEQKLYQKAKKWWEKEGREYWEGIEPVEESVMESKPPEEPAISAYTFANLSGLVDLAQQVASLLKVGGEG